MSRDLPAFPIELQVRSGRGASRQLHVQLREAILEGRLATGFRLPASRDLASLLGTARATVVVAYDMLAAEGYVRTRRGDGTFVQSVRRASALTRPRLQVETPSPNASQPRFDLRLGSPDLSSFPFDVWRRLEARSWRQLANDGYDAIHPAGVSELRAAIVGHASYLRAVACSSDDVVVTAGAQQAFDLLARVMIRPGMVVAVEDPGYTPMRRAFAALGAQLVGVPVDAEGLVVSRIPADARLICVTPSHQFPLGLTLSAARRTALLAHAKQHDALIVEDDYDCEYRFGARPLDALQTLAPDRVCYVGTFSKTMFPALRLGYLVAPSGLRDQLVQARALSDGGGAPAAQRALAAFIAEGHLRRHIRRMERRYATRRDILIKGLSSRLGDRIAIVPSAAGLHFSLELKGEADWNEIERRASAASVAFERCSRYSLGQEAENFCAIGLGLVPEHEAQNAVERLTEIFAQ